MKKKGFESRFNTNFLVGLGAGLYPFLHYYNGNFDLADSWVQLAFLVGICLLLPQLLLAASPFVFKLNFLRRFEKHRRTAVNLVLFFGLLGMLIFLFKKKAMAVTIAGAALLSLLVYKQLAKLVMLQLLLAVLSLVTLVPKLMFMGDYSTNWTIPSDTIMETSFKQHPNIYLIQPDGYSSFKHLRKPPYSYLDTTFENSLTQREFTHYPNFRSNYYSTLTSNAALFSMKHHYYGNTFPGNLKTYGAQAAIVGEQSNAAQILKKNGYTNHLITDNSYFLVNRKLSAFDRCNVPQSKVLLWDTGGIRGIDIATDLEAMVKEASPSHNFYFIEKTLPSHINYGKGASLGLVGERGRYLERLEAADEWINSLLAIINENDPNALIILAADHGGYVGLEYVKEVEQHTLSAIETVSVFNSLLAIKWPANNPPVFEIESTVNVFRQLFSYLAEDPGLLEHLEPNTSYLPLYEGSKALFYECIDENYQVVNKPL